MAQRFNAVTGQFEDDEVENLPPIVTTLTRHGSSALVRPGTGAPMETYPDEVAPGDLVTAPDPRHPYGKPMLGSTDSVQLPAENPAPARMASAPNAIPLAPRDVTLTDDQKARLAANEHMMGLDQPPGHSGDPDRARAGLDLGPAGLEPAQPGALASPAAPRKAGGGGGRGPANDNGHLTAAEAVAQGGLQTAQDEQAAAMGRGTELEARKAGDLAKQAEEQAKAVAQAQDDWKAKRQAAEEHLQQREDAAAKTKITDIFEGKPLQAVLSAIASGVGARAAAITGTENTALRVADTAAKAYREKQQAMYEREMAGVKNEQDRLQFSTMQAAADEAGLYRRFEMDRTKLLQTYGADEARIKGDTLLSEFRTKQAEKKSEIATALYNRGQAEVMQAAQVSNLRSNAAQNYASARKLNAEAAAGTAGEGRAATTQIQKATLAEHGQAALDVIDDLQGKGVKLTKADLALIQDNRAKLKGAQEVHGTKDAIGLSIGRAIKAIPRSEYQGLSAEKQKLANAYDILAQKGAALVSPSHSEEEIRHARQFFELTPGDDDAIRAQKLEYARNQIGTAKEMGGRYTQRAFSGAEKQRAAAPAGNLSDEQAAQANAYLMTNPNDPDAPAIRAKLQQYRAAKGR